VIVHELLHMRIPNHGRLFSSSLRAHLRGNRWVARGLMAAAERRSGMRRVS
jgi:predicted metallopeptidase